MLLVPRRHSLNIIITDTPFVFLNRFFQLAEAVIKAGIRQAWLTKPVNRPCNYPSYWLDRVDLVVDWD
ncbi:hypothetical protein DIU31_008040 [Mucilaginibacter rubeus]|uniref:Uncharacterized protein n=1 Tax=Mucilaginibacter rubeus TaxID=2027860 RepID=A0AAE6MHD2_9SPHI|nr:MULTISPECIES: hypothetical protein [Mucilaginibacter]QEM03470.1 hypothetical protein DIU31_008040 [Mucilaginibacter rubeus]QEM16085.1 hypothetical protein DIU38_008125 [Mucilaginibacter gossypii]QTE41161.1 hypothetical protein J3L19_19630 [Mucilaginibacter rubeus]QTE47765.1 hypothetical protein J3L21_19615 [Mucilaginibacter rubeus]QTE59156.1 hypothetical protein J3L23_11275 [Mucilaginibacter rubeus]